MSETLLGAVIAGGCGVLTTIVGGVIKHFLDKYAYKREVEKIKQEREAQKDAEYLQRRISVYENVIAHFVACLSFFNAVFQQGGQG